MLLKSRLLAVLKIGFGVSMVGAFIMAVSPVQMSVAHSDKALHFLVFYGLTLMAAVSFPLVHPILIALGMSAFGGVIEIVQGLPIVGRDRELADWIADSLAIAAALLPMTISRWRTRND